MEWRAIPGYPGYEVNRKGSIRNAASGYIYGTTANLKVNGKQKWANGTKLAAVIFAEPSPAPAPAPAPEPVPARDAEKELLYVERDEARAERDEALRSMEVLRVERDEARAERDEARRSLELARRVNGHQMTLIDRLRSIIAELEAGPKKRGGKRGRRPAALPAYREFKEAPAFDGGLELEL
jgi:hypothetical protein